MIGEEAAEPAYMSMQTITHTFIIAKPGIDPGHGGNDEEDVSEQDAKFKICNNKSEPTWHSGVRVMRGYEGLRKV
jgi:hypothetical protein